MPKPAVISLQAVSKRFGSFLAVDNVSFNIAEGEFFSMLGPSGCGKTTTLRMIAGFETPTEGAILLDGADVSNVKPHRRQVNTVFQHYALFPHMTVLDNVAYGPRAAGASNPEARRRAAEMLELVQLGEFGGRKPAQLSGGQQQRVALARALVNMPKALLLDEPLGALDLKLRHYMQTELKRIQREVGITFVYVTHDQEEALTMSDRVAVMTGGQVEQLAPPDEIYDDPASVFVADFIGNANLVAATVDGPNSARAFGTVVPARSRHSAATTGATKTLMVRPERVRLSPVPSEGSVRLVVTDVTFAGPMLRIGATADNHDELIAHVGREHLVAPLGPGDVIHASWDLDSAHLLDGSPAATLDEASTERDSS